MLSRRRRTNCDCYESNWQAPGPPGWPQLPQPIGISLAMELEALMAAKVESFLCSSVLWQPGHSGAGADERTSVSNSLPHALQEYSKIGMVAPS